MTRLSIGISLEQNIVTEVDARRGMIPRSRFIEKLILEFIHAEYGKMKSEGGCN